MEKLSQAPFSTEPEMIAPPADHRAFAMRVKRTVRRHSGGGVKALEVRVDDETIRLGGRCVSFYCKQLAQQAVMLLKDPRQVVNEIVVESD